MSGAVKMVTPGTHGSGVWMCKLSSLSCALSYCSSSIPGPRREVSKAERERGLIGRDSGILPGSLTAASRLELASEPPRRVRDFDVLVEKEKALKDEGGQPGSTVLTLSVFALCVVLPLADEPLVDERDKVGCDTVRSRIIWGVDEGARAGGGDLDLRRVAAADRGVAERM